MPNASARPPARSPGAWSWLLLPLAAILPLAGAGAGVKPAASEYQAISAVSYARERVSCSEHAMVSDPFKEMASELDAIMRDTTATTVTLEDERRVGREALDAVPTNLGGHFAKDDARTRYLTAVLGRLAHQPSRSEISFSVHLLDGVTMENAFALPGGYIVVTEPMLRDRIRNEAQLAAVLGHEMAHVDRRHCVALLQYVRSMGIPDDEVITQILLLLARRPYSTAIEEEADNYGTSFSMASGYSPSEAVALWDRWAAEAEPLDFKIGLPILDAALEVVGPELEYFFATHPAPARRACLLRQVSYDWLEGHPRTSMYVGATAFQARQPVSF